MNEEEDDEDELLAKGDGVYENGNGKGAACNNTLVLPNKGDDDAAVFVEGSRV